VKFINRITLISKEIESSKIPVKCKGAKIPNLEKLFTNIYWEKKNNLVIYSESPQDKESYIIIGIWNEDSGEPEPLSDYNKNKARKRAANFNINKYGDYAEYMDKSKKSKDNNEQCISACVCVPNPKYIAPKFPKTMDDSYNFEIIKRTKIGKDTSDDKLLTTAVLSLFRKITNEDAETMGLKCRPENFVMQSMLVTPPNSRDVFTSADGTTNHSDMTNNYNEIVKAANKLRNNTDDKDTDRLRYLLFLKVYTFYQGHKTKTGTYKKTSLKDELQGKKGKPRQTIMGKRVNMCARSVAGINTELRFTQIGVPETWAPTLTMSEVVTHWNKGNLEKLLEQGKITSVEHKNKDNKVIRMPVNSDTVLHIGDTIYRHLMNGDIIIFNRQPSLHKYSMPAAEVVLHPGLSIQTHISATPGLNLDYDGDEINLWATVYIEAIVEANELLHMKNNIMSAAKNRPITGLVYDSITSSYMITEDKEINEGMYYELRELLSNQDDIITLNDRLASNNVPRLSGKGVYSMLFPPDFNYSRGKVTIRDGVLISGPLNKDDIGAGGAVITSIYMKYGAERVSQFITDAAFVTLNYITEKGLSVGISDCMAMGKAEYDLETREKEKIFKSIDSEIRVLGPKPEDPIDAKIYEESVSNIIKAGEEKIFKIIKGRITKKSNMMGVMGKDTGAGTKGEAFNQRQISGSVGQQYLKGERVGGKCGQRLLLKYDENDINIRSSGYISSSFMDGLTPEEHFTLMLAGREGLVDTAVNVPTIGDIHRKITEALKNIIIDYSGSVVNADNVMFQLIYGGDGLDPSKIHMVKTLGSENRVPAPVDIFALARELNTEAGWIPE
jgi:DNA-directed RNA polymerase subunit A'